MTNVAFKGLRELGIQLYWNQTWAQVFSCILLMTVFLGKLIFNLIHSNVIEKKQILSLENCHRRNIFIINCFPYLFRIKLIEKLNDFNLDIRVNVNNKHVKLNKIKNKFDFKYCMGFSLCMNKVYLALNNKSILNFHFSYFGFFKV